MLWSLSKQKTWQGSWSYRTTSHRIRGEIPEEGTSKLKDEQELAREMVGKLFQPQEPRKIWNHTCFALVVTGREKAVGRGVAVGRQRVGLEESEEEPSSADLASFDRAHLCRCPEWAQHSQCSGD